MPIDVECTFDKKNYRHYLNGHLFVLHCHHYLCLTTKMAQDFKDLKMDQILSESAEDTIRPLIDDYIEKKNGELPKSAFVVGIEYYSIMGLGKMAIKALQDSGEVSLLKSHIDQGWIKKWGVSEECVNYFTCGFIAAIFGAAFALPLRSFSVVEVESISKGDEKSFFNINRV